MKAGRSDPPVDRGGVELDAQLRDETFRFLVENVVDYAIFMLDPNGIVLTWNAGARRSKGYEASEIIGKHFSIFYPPEDVKAGKPQAELREAIAVGRVEDEGWRVRKDGTRFWANVVITALRDPSGQLRGFAKVTRDLTARREADEAERKLAEEQAARVAAERARRAIEAAYDRVARLQVVGAALVEAKTPEGIADAVLTATRGFLSAFGGLVYLRSDDRETIEAIATTPDPRIEGARQRFGRMSIDERLPPAEVVKTGVPRFFASHAELRAAYPGLPEPSLSGAQAMAVLPLSVKGDTFGALVLCFAEVRPFTAEDREFLASMAHGAASALERMRLVDEVIRERQLLDAVLQQMPSALAITDATGRRMLANTHHERIFRMSPVASPGTMAEYGRFRGLHPDGRPLTADEWPMARSLKRGEIVSGEEIEIVRGDGTSGHIRVNSAPVRDQEGRIVAGVVTYDDVSDEKRAQDEIRRSREQLQLIADALPALIIDVERDAIAFANRAAAEWLGAGAGALVGRPVAALGAEIAGQLAPHAARALAGEVATFEGRLAFPTGARDVRAQLVPQPQRGTGAGYVVLMTDVSDHKRIEDGVRFLAEASKVLGSSLDVDVTLKAVASLAVPRLADWCAVEIVREDGASEQLAVAHFDPAKVAFAHELNRRYPPNKQSATGVPNVLRTGQAELYTDIPEELLERSAVDDEHRRLIRALEIHSGLVVPIKARGGTVGAITLIGAESGRRFDEVELSVAQELGVRAGLAVENASLFREAQEAIQKRDDFLSVASHELKTPLTSLELQLSNILRAIDLGRTEILEPSRLRERVARAEAQITRVTGLINQLLDVSRISAGRLALDLEADVDLRAIVDEVVARYGEPAHKAACPVRVSGADRLTGRWDKNRVDQVVTNLLSNAIKYGAGKPIELRLGEGPLGVRLEVVDHGMGIDEDDQGRVFQRFERTSAAKNYGGIGLGLWIVRQIVEAHHGRVEVASRVGEGATFTVDLPRDSGDTGAG